jgi:cytochrome b pre-mRNA-processing protein 3
MFSRLYSLIRPSRNDNAASYYGVIVAQARCPTFYAEMGVPDSVGGRFEMVLMHVILVTRHLESGDHRSRELGQAIFDLFCSDMDNSLREMGVGDLSVPKHMRRVGEAYFGRMAAYGPGLSSGDVSALAEVLERTVFGGSGDVAPAARNLAAYALTAAEQLDEQGEQSIVSDGPRFPAVDPFGCGVAP